jgi:hypothetical protein
MGSLEAACGTHANVGFNVGFNVGLADFLGRFSSLAEAMNTSQLLGPFDFFRLLLDLHL